MLLFIGTYTDPVLFGTGKVMHGKGEGIYVFHLEASSGAMRPVSKITGITNPSYLAFDRTRRFLYAVNELKAYEGQPSGTVSAFAVERDTGRLSFLNKQLTHGTDPCHVLVDDRGRHVFVANFMSGSICVLPVRRDGSLGQTCGFVQHEGSSVDPVRQGGPHAHSVTLDEANRFAFVPDLGLDRLMVYRFDSERGALEPNAVPWLKTKAGAGPRHMVFKPGGAWAYLVNELESTVQTLAYDGETGTFEDLGSVTALPFGYTGPSTCADIQLSPSGKHVYVSNRGHDSIAIYAVDPRSGTLGQVGHELTLGRTPRGFGIDPSGRYLVAANQDSDTVVVFRIDPESGRLTPTGQIAEVPTPACVKFL